MAHSPNSEPSQDTRPAGVPAPLAEVTALIQRYPAAAPVSLLSQILRVHADTASVAEHATREPKRTAAALAASLSCGLVARAYLDLGDPRAAIAQADVALRYADHADSPGARARYRALQSEAAHWAGWPHEAIRYARLGGGAPAPTGTGFAILKLVEARSHAVLGSDAEAMRALQVADAALAEAVGPDALDMIAGNLHLHGARRHYYEAEVRIHMRGSAREAAECALSAIKLFGADGPMEPTGSQVHAQAAPEAAAATAVLALAYARQRLLDAVGETLDALLALDPSRRTAPVALSAARVHAALRRPEWIHNRSVREMQEQIEAFCQVPAGSMPNG